MVESIGRFRRITAEEAHQRFTSRPLASTFGNHLATLFATMAPLEHYELALRRRETGSLIWERIIRFAQENNIDGLHVRAGKAYGRRTIIVWREVRPGQTPSADIPPEAAEQVTPVAEVVPDAVIDENNGVQPLAHEKSQNR